MRPGGAPEPAGGTPTLPEKSNRHRLQNSLTCLSYPRGAREARRRKTLFHGRSQKGPRYLIRQLAKQLSEANKRAEGLGLNHEEVAFYDALAQNNSALEIMGKDNLKVIATEPVTQVRRNATINWTLGESTRAKIKGLANSERVREQAAF